MRTGPGAAAPAQTAGSTIASDAPCIRCSYNLVGLAETGNCPECGLPAALSLHSALLANASVAYLRSMRSGLCLIPLCAGVAVGAGVWRVVWGPFPGLFLFAPDGAIYASGLLLLASAASLWGYWKFTAPDPGIAAGEQPVRARWVVRGCSVVSAVLALVSAAADWLSVVAGGPLAAFLMPHATLSVVSLVVWPLKLRSMMTYVAWLAPRVPDARLKKQAEEWRYLLLVIYFVGSIVFWLSPLITLVMYVSILFRVWKRLGSIIRSVERFGTRQRLGGPGDRA